MVTVVRREDPRSSSSSSRSRSTLRAHSVCVHQMATAAAAASLHRRRYHSTSLVASLNVHRAPRSTNRPTDVRPLHADSWSAATRRSANPVARMWMQADCTSKLGGSHASIGGSRPMNFNSASRAEMNVVDYTRRNRNIMIIFLQRHIQDLKMGFGNESPPVGCRTKPP